MSKQYFTRLTLNDVVRSMSQQSSQPTVLKYKLHCFDLTLLHAFNGFRLSIAVDCQKHSIPVGTKVISVSAIQVPITDRQPQR